MCYPAPYTVPCSMSQMYKNVTHIPLNVIEAVVLAGTEITVISHATSTAKNTFVTEKPGNVTDPVDMAGTEITVTTHATALGIA